MTIKRYRVLPYRQGSASAKALATALGGKVLKLEGSTFKPKPDDVVINWGRTEPTPTSTLVYWGGTLNKAQFVKEASNKLLFFKKLAGLDLTPQFWENPDDIPDEAFPVVCRTVLAGHSGAGIVIAATRNDLVSCSLYVKYEKKKDEYRVHFGRSVPTSDSSGSGTGTGAGDSPSATSGSPASGSGGTSSTVITVQRKAKRTGVEDANFQVRNLANGFIYVRQNVVPPECVLDLARKAFENTGLDFGAVDVIYNAHHSRAYVLEINTAPGLEGQTIEDYANYFRSL